MTEYETMTYERKGKIGYIMLNRPQSLNAVNDQFERDLPDALLEFDIDEDAWVAIIHGAGRCFCAGADIKQRLVNMTPQQSARRTMGSSSEGYLGRSINWKPVIAAIHGYALGALLRGHVDQALLDVGAGAEAATSSVDNGHPGILIDVELQQSIGQVQLELVVDRVKRLGPVQHNVAYLALTLIGHSLVFGHSLFLLSWWWFPPIFRPVFHLETNGRTFAALTRALAI